MMPLSLPGHSSVNSFAAPMERMTIPKFESRNLLIIQWKEDRVYRLSRRYSTSEPFEIPPV
jgi:hypothetical protein